jgi:hypothetical protein
MIERQPQIRFGAATVSDDAPVSSEAKRQRTIAVKQATHERTFFHEVANNQKKQRFVRSGTNSPSRFRRIDIQRTQFSQPPRNFGRCRIHPGEILCRQKIAVIRKRHEMIVASAN